MKKNVLRNSLKFSFLDGIFASAMIGFTDNFWVACAESLQVSALSAGLVSTFPQLISSFTQTAAGTLTDKIGGRLKTAKRVIILQWSSLIPLIFLPFAPRDVRYLLLLICAVLFSIGGALPGPVWLSLMSSHLPLKSKGKYFGWRNSILGIVSLACGLLAGRILQGFKRDVLEGFSILFGLAFICRFISWSFLCRMYDPGTKTPGNGSQSLKTPMPDSFLKFLREGVKNNFVAFSFFVACFNLSVNTVGPYLPVYMLRDLHYSYTTFTYVTFSATLMTIFGVKIWGELADKFGDLKVIRATASFICIVPILWLISANSIWLILVQIAAGFAWAGFNLCVMMFAFSEVPDTLRTRAIGYLSALNGIAIFSGSYLGGTLIGKLPSLNGTSFGWIFVLSFALRTLTASFFFKRVREIRPTLPVSTFDLYAGALGLQTVYQSGKDMLETVFSRKRS